MIFNCKVFPIAALASFAVFFSGCSKFLEGKPSQPNFIEVKNDNLKCLKDVSSKVKFFLTTQVTAKEIDQTFDCLDITLNEFQVRAEGSQDKQSFSSEDLFQIFETFIKEAEVSRDATVDILKLKTAVLGGDNQKLTKTEISQLRAYLQILKPEVHLLLPYVHLFTFKKATDTVVTKETIASGFKQLEHSLKRLVEASHLIRSDYVFEDFKLLVDHLKLIPEEHAGLVDLATDVKNLLTGSEILQTKSDFDSVIESFIEILRLHSLNTQGLVLFEIKDASALNESVSYIESWLRILENSIQFRKKNIISTTTMDPFVAKIAEQGILPIQMKTETLQQFYRTLLVRVFEKGSTGDTAVFEGLKKIHFVNIKREISTLKLYMSFLNQLKIPENGRMPISQIQAALVKYDFKVPLAKMDIAPQTSEHSKILQFVHELRNEFLSDRPVVYRFNKMVIAVNQEIWDQNWQDLARGVFVKFLARELMIGWGNAFETRSIWNAVMTEADLTKWYAEFKNFGLETKAFDPRTENSGPRSFKEANLFSYAADGNTQMSFLETLQYLNILTSGGSQTYQELVTGFSKVTSTKANCQVKDEIDVFGNPWINEACAYKDFKENYKYYFNNLSYLVGFLNRLDDKNFSEFYNEAMDVARINPAAKGKLETADLRTFSILLHYIESIYAQFDVDRNWSFSHQEIRWAYPRFKNFATEFAQQTAQEQLELFNLPLVQALGYGCYSQEDLIQESFIFLVYNGVTPGITDLNPAPCLGKRSLINFKGEVDRRTIIKTFKILKAVLGS